MAETPNPNSGITRELRLYENVEESEQGLKLRLLEKLEELRVSNGFVAFIFSKHGPHQPARPLKEFIPIILHDYATEYLSGELLKFENDLTESKYVDAEKITLRSARLGELKQEVSTVEKLLQAFAPNSDQRID